jgi:hypothetical protein
MDFSKLDQNEKLAVYGAAAVIVGALVGYGASGLGVIALLAAIAMLAIIFLPQMSPSTKLPGSKGSLMLIAGAAAAVVLVLGLLNLLTVLGALLRFSAIATIFYLIAVVGGVVMAWAGWQELQREGGKWVLGSSGAAGTDPAAAAPPAPPAAEPVVPTEPETPAPSATSADTVAADAPADDPYRRDDEDRPTA